MKVRQVAVLGSGPSSLACTLGLLKERLASNVLDFEITVLDYGRKPNTMDKTKLHLGKGNSSNDPLSNPPKIFSTISLLTDGIYGSADFGGWSNYWGATGLQYSNRDLKTLGINKEELENAQRILSQHVNILNTNINEIHGFSNFGGEKSEITRKNVDLSNRKTRLRDFEKFNVPPQVIDSLLFIRNFDNDINYGCTQCGECLKGCPKDHIWNTRSVWQELVRDNLINWHEGVWLKSVQKNHKNNGELIIDYVDINDVENQKSFDSVFLGLGAIQSTLFLHRSNILKGKSQLNENQMVTVPLLYLKKIKNENLERISLSDKMFMCQTDDQGRILSQGGFAQVYFYSNSLDEILLKKISILRYINLEIRKKIFRRLCIAMIFLPESENSKIDIELIREKGYIQSSKTNPKIKKLYYISKFLRLFPVFPFYIFMKLTPPGGSFHFGKLEFDLQKNENKKKVRFLDSLGRVEEFDNLHVIDSSSLRKLGPWPTTLTTMINSIVITSRVTKNWKQL